MEIVFTDTAIKDLKFWKMSGNKIIQQRIEQLIKSIIESPFEGIGKHEVL
jgi:toxin YoeB